MDYILHILGLCPDSLAHPNMIALVTALDDFFKFKK